MMKRFMSLLFSIVMAAGLCVPALAVEAGGGTSGDDGFYVVGDAGGLKDTGATTAEGQDGSVPESDRDYNGDGAISESVQGHAEAYDSSNPDAYIPDGAVVPDQKAAGAANGDPEYATLLISQSFLTFLEDDDFTTVYQVSAYEDGSLA